MDKIAVIIPVYNSEPWLKRCLDSVLAAADDYTYIYVVDDGSADMSAVILSNYARKHCNITLLKQEHMGPGEARRKGVEAAYDAKWICFVDSDDTMVPDGIRLLRKFTDDQYDIVCGNIAIHNVSEKSLLTQGEITTQGREQMAEDLLEGRMLGVIYGKLIRRSLFDRIVWDTHRSLTNHEDVMLMINLACAMESEAINVPGIIVYNYIRRAESLSSMISLRPEGVEHLWNNIKRLDLPRVSLVRWGLGILYGSFIERGIEFPNSYPPARELRQLARGLRLGAKHKPVLAMLYSSRLRRYVMRKHLRNGKLTIFSPHISFIIVVHDDIHGLKRTLKSIFNTGFRNIEIIIVDDASSQECAIRINELHVKYRRIHLIKTASRIGPSAARLKAVRQSSAICTMFLNPGDTVESRGVYKAICSIDDGTDIAIMGRRAVSTFCRSKVFDPDFRHVAPEQREEAIIDYLLRNFYFEAPLGGLVIRRAILSDDDFPPSNDLSTSHVHEMLTRIALHLRPQNYDLISTLGYNRAISRRDYLAPMAQWERDVKLAYAVLMFLNESDAVEFYPQIIQGLRTAFIRTLSRLAANPFRSREGLVRFMREALCNPTFEACLKIAGNSPETKPLEAIVSDENIQTVVDEAIALYRKHRWSYLRFFLLHV